jgi:hypothetical protein
VPAKRRVCSKNERIKFQALKFRTKEGNVRITYHWCAFVQTLSPNKTNKYYVFCECVSSLRYPARNAHAPYCLLWSVRPYNIFPYYLINGIIFEERLQNIKFVLIFSTTFVWNFFDVLKSNISFIRVPNTEKCNVTASNGAHQSANSRRGHMT